MIILDTNVLSEGLRPWPSPNVMRWMQSEPIAALCTSTITEAEMLFGAALLPEGRRRRALEAVLEQLLGTDLPDAFCRSTVRRRASLPISLQVGGWPDGRSVKQMAASQPLLDPAVPRSLLGMSSTLPIAD